MIINWVEILGVFFGMAILSFSFKDNPIYKFVESLYLGSAAGYVLIMNLNRAYTEGFLSLSKDPLLLIPILLGIMMYARLFKQISWVSRYPLAFLTALGIGVSTRTLIETDVLKQISSSALPLIVFNQGSFDIIKTFSNLIIIISVSTVVSYFLYSREQKGILKTSTNIGLSFMMIGFGTAVATSLLSRVSKTIGLLQTLIIVPSGIYMVPIMIVILILSVFPEKIGLKKKSQ